MNKLRQRLVAAAATTVPVLYLIVETAGTRVPRTAPTTPRQTARKEVISMEKLRQRLVAAAAATVPVLYLIVETAGSRVP